MTSRPGPLQSSWNSGAIAPELHGRSDVKQVYAACAIGRNIEPVPQGGFCLAPRSRRIGRVRAELSPVTPASLVADGSPLGLNGIIVLATLAAPTPIAMVEMTGFASSVALFEGVLVEWLDPADASWKTFAPVYSSGAAVNRKAARPPGEPVLTTAIRLRRSIAGAAASFSIATFRLLREGTTYSNVRARPFSFSSDQAYEAVFTDFNVDFWRDGVFCGSASTYFGGTSIERIDVRQRFDTMLLFDENTLSQRIMRQGADHVWNWDPIPFEHVPEVDLGGSYTDTNDVWQIYVRWGTAGAVGLQLVVSVSGEETNAVTVAAGPDWPSFVVALKTAIEALAGVEPGIGVSYGPGTNVAVFTVAFGGGANAGQEFVVSARIVNSTEAAATTAHVTTGHKGGEALFSGTRGFASAAAFYQDRLITGGFKAKKGALLGSVTGDYFDVNTEVQAATGAILINLDTDGAERIQRLVAGRHLVIFTSDGEYFISDRNLQRGQPQNVVKCSENGSAPTVPIVSSEGSLLYVGKKRSQIYAATYSDVSQAYESEPTSLLASHLVEAVCDAALQRASEDSDADRHFLVRDDGVMIVAHLIRNQEVGAFVEWATDGLIKSVMVNGAGKPAIIVERTVAGAPVRFLERLDPDPALFLDCARTITLAPASTAVTGLADYEGATIWAVADGFVSGPFIVAGGAITLPYPASSVTVGRWVAPIMDSLPANRDVGPRIVLRRPGRIHTLQLNLLDTTSIAIGANGLRARDQMLYRAGDPTDVPLAPVSRQITVTGLRGFTDAPSYRITQTRPGRLQVRDVVTQARL